SAHLTVPSERPRVRAKLSGADALLADGALRSGQAVVPGELAPLDLDQQRAVGVGDPDRGCELPQLGEQILARREDRLEPGDQLLDLDVGLTVGRWLGRELEQTYENV